MLKKWQATLLLLGGPIYLYFMSENLEAVLRRVAAGDLTPDEALRLIDGPLHQPPEPDAGPVPSRAGPTPAYGSAEATAGVTTVRIKVPYRSLQVFADPTVSQLHVTGSHSIQQQGSTLLVTTSGPFDDDERGGSAGSRSPSATGGRFSFSDLPRTIAWARSWRDHQLIVRMNPELALDLDTTGAEVKITGLQAGLRANLVASSFKADKIQGELDLKAFSSSLKLTARPTGTSRLYCESSSARVTLARGTDTRITATNRMGRLSLPDQPVSTLPFEGESREVRLGDGRDSLAVEAVMSSVTITAQLWDDVPS